MRKAERPSETRKAAIRAAHARLPKGPGGKAKRAELYHLAQELGISVRELKEIVRSKPDEK